MISAYPIANSNESRVPEATRNIKHRKFLKGRYLPVMILKSDIKGDVYKGISFKKILSPQWCLIKQGKRKANLDEYGRDMHDRLNWQQKLNASMSGFINMPAITDCFVEKEDMFLITDFIEGETLNECVDRIFLRSEHINIQDQQILAGYLIDISENLAQLHAAGFVHRDLSPANFLINKGKKISFIDMELAYSIVDNEPNPPFVWGTPGFMTPSQLANERPCFQDDIYGLGSLMLFTITGTKPDECGLPDLTKVKNLLLRYSSSGFLIELILAALDPDPGRRPGIANILYDLQSYYETLNG
jgi:serine/threonine protein kinase